MTCGLPPAFQSAFIAAAGAGAAADTGMVPKAAATNVAAQASSRYRERRKDK